MTPGNDIPETTLDAYFKGPITVLSKRRIDINGTLLSDAAIQHLAGCPAGGEVSVAQDDVAIYLESRHDHLIVNDWRNANYVEIRSKQEGISLYLDYIRFAETCPKNFGAVVLPRMAHEAHGLGFSNIELLAAGGSGIKGHCWTEDFWGYEAWPRLGFDTVLHPAMLKLIEPVPHLHGMTRVSQIIEADLPWWKEHGDGWDMTFDLTPGSASWTTLHQYCLTRGLLP